METSNLSHQVKKKHVQFKPEIPDLENNKNEYESPYENENKDIDEKPSKLDILIINQGWNNKNEQFIVSIGENSASFKYMHEKVSARYIIYDNFIKIFITIGSVIIAADSFTIIFQTSDIASIIQKVITVILAIISIVYNFLNYASLSSEHSNFASSFGILYHDIRNVMCLYRKDRPNAITYIQRAIKEYDHLEVSGPNIPNWQLKDFKKKFKDSISIPDISDNIQKIEIIQEPGKKSEQIEQKTNFNLNNDNNLKKIQQSFQIDGDLSENDNLTFKDLLKRKENLSKQSEYEMNRFMSNIVKNTPDNLA